MKLLIILLILALTTVSAQQQQQQDEIVRVDVTPTIVSTRVEIDEPQQQQQQPENPFENIFSSLFSSILGGGNNNNNNGEMMVEQQPPRLRHLMRPSFFSRAINFGSNNNDDETSDEQPVAIVQITTSSADDEDDGASSSDDDMMAPMMSGIFRRMNRFFDMLRSQTDAPAGMKSRGCPVERACGADIDQLCKSSRMSMIRGAVSLCLKSHESELSTECSAMMNKIWNKQQQQQQQQQQQEEEAAKKEEEDAAAAAAAAPAHEHSDKLPCMSEVKNMCTSRQRYERSTHGMMGIYDCLMANYDSLSSQCKESLDAAAKLQQEQAKQTSEAVVSTTSPAPATPPTFHMSAHQALFQKVSNKVHNMPQASIIMGLIGLVALIAAGVVVRHVRRRRRRRHENGGHVVPQNETVVQLSAPAVVTSA